MYVSRTRIFLSNTINLKNINLDINVKNVETENDGAKTEENTQSATFRDKFKTKLKLVSMNLLSSVRMLVLKLWKTSKRVFLWL
jgi:hypothetical protein